MNNLGPLPWHHNTEQLPRCSFMRLAVSICLFPLFVRVCVCVFPMHSSLFNINYHGTITRAGSVGVDVRTFCNALPLGDGLGPADLVLSLLSIQEVKTTYLSRQGRTSIENNHSPEVRRHTWVCHGQTQIQTSKGSLGEWKGQCKHPSYTQGTGKEIFDLILCRSRQVFYTHASLQLLSRAMMDGDLYKFRTGHCNESRVWGRPTYPTYSGFSAKRDSYNIHIHLYQDE